MSDQPTPTGFAELHASLDRKEQEFVDEYLECFNAALAARRVWTGRHAKQKGYAAMRRPDVAAAIDAGIREKKERTNNDPDRIILELMQVAYADPIDLVDRAGNPLPLRQLAPEIRRALASFDVETVSSRINPKGEDASAGATTRTTTRVVRYKLVPKLPALELLGKRLKMFSDRLELDAGDSLAALIKASYNRPKEPTT